eukprot:Tamp_17296.p1 GENE.Tamp_17296~~Tamp_17296.p1  ORF type:complete len:307 (-),score=47.65 Tamp_17296:480-1331(-)
MANMRTAQTASVLALMWLAAGPPDVCATPPASDAAGNEGEVGSNATGGVAMGMTLEADPALISRGLFKAITDGNVTKVRQWLALGVDPNIGDLDDPDEGESPLMRAAAYDRSEITGLLLQHGADAKLRNFEGKTALMVAASRGHVATMSQLFRHPPYSQQTGVVVAGGARMEEDAQDRHGKSALIWASYMGQAEAVRDLAKRGVDLELPDESGRTALMWAVTAADGLRAVHGLLEAGASPSSQDAVGATALTWAIERGRKDVLETLAKYEYGPETELLETSGI